MDWVYCRDCFERLDYMEGSLVWQSMEKSKTGHRCGKCAGIKAANEIIDTFRKRLGLDQTEKEKR